MMFSLYIQFCVAEKIGLHP